MSLKDDIKAVVFDFDGTLVNYELQASDYTKKALWSLKEKGYTICLASGRPCFMAQRGFEEAFKDYPLDYIFGYNGGEYQDVRSGKTTELFALSYKDIRYLCKLFDVPYLYFCVYENDNLLVNKPIQGPELLNWLNSRKLNMQVHDFSNNDKQYCKVICLNNEGYRKQEDELLNSLDLSAYSYAYTNRYLFEIMPKQVSKKLCIDKLCEILNCQSQQILSFGDMDNDMSMLLNSYGVIMDNADPKLKKLIKHHTSDVNEMGIYQFLADNELI